MGRQGRQGALQHLPPVFRTEDDVISKIEYTVGMVLVAVAHLPKQLFSAKNSENVWRSQGNCLTL